MTPTTTNFPCRPFTLSEAADRWLEVYAEKQANYNLRNLEQKIRLDPNLKSKMKDSIKSLLRDKLKERFLDDPPSLAMATIIDVIVNDCLLSSAMPGKGRLK